jgi:hypothetical protein
MWKHYHDLQFIFISFTSHMINNPTHFQNYLINLRLYFLNITIFQLKNKK